MWLDMVKEELGDNLQITWRSFALEQVNSEHGRDWKAWEQGTDYTSRGLWPLRGGIAARQQGSAEHNEYMAKILHAKHVERDDVRTRESILEIAVSASLDIDNFTEALDDPKSLKSIGNDHEYARALGIFGTPTFVFGNGLSTFVKMFTPPKHEAMDAFKHFMGIASERTYFGEKKRPQPPWPRGAGD